VKKTIDQVLAEHTPSLMSIRGVLGTAQGLCEGTACIKIYVAKDVPELWKRLPACIEGYPVSLEETGDFQAFS
jgi:hypothetical protein